VRFYSNFESKDELFVELNHHHLDAEVDTLSRALDRIKSADDLAPAIEPSLPRGWRRQVAGACWTTEFQLYTSAVG